MKKKLIEVALPLEAINRESAREKSIRHGHPSTLHLWWSRKPLATCRAVLFASLVDDPSSLPEFFPTEAAQDEERQRLFAILEELVRWENSNNTAVIERARVEILRSTDGQPPPIYDPFCGGGSIPLEAQRLGLDSYGSDLNPVAVLITKALIEIPQNFAGQPPVNPVAKSKMAAIGMWSGATGLADDVLHYGNWIRDRAEERIGHLYPKIRLENGEDSTVIAWLWTRTVVCPNPACGARMPLTSKFVLSTKKGKESWAEPIVDHTAKTVRFEIRSGVGGSPEGTVGRKGARCLVCETAVPLEHIRSEGRAGRMDCQLMGIVAEGKRDRVFLAPTQAHEAVAKSAIPVGVPTTLLPKQALGFRVQAYGMTSHSDLFTQRQLVALTTLSDLVLESRQEAIRDGATEARADAIATYLAFGLSRLSDMCNSLCMWENTKTQVRHLFTRQAVSMLWDFAEANVFAEAAGDYIVSLKNLCKALKGTCTVGGGGHASQLDARMLSKKASFSTDPPYYDNIGYSDLSDFFYVWLRRILAPIYPDIFSTLLVPKKQELSAASERFDGDRDAAKRYFESGFASVFSAIRQHQAPNFPATIYYAFKQAEIGGEGESPEVTSTGWETMLEGLIRAQFQITATWPMSSELGNRMRGLGSNVLATSIVLACRSRPDSAPITTRKDFLVQLKNELPTALRNLQKGNVAPVDMAQAAIGPGMAVFSRYSRVLEANGESMRVRTALGLINQTLDEVLSEQESDFDPDTRWALQWFEQYQFNEAPFGQAETLASAKAVSIQGLQEGGILLARAGKVRLIPRDELDPTWDPTTDGRLTIWEVTQHLIRVLETRGEPEAAELKAKLGGAAEAARELAYRLYALCERKGWAQEAGAYNNLVVRWPDLRSDEFSLS